RRLDVADRVTLVDRVAVVEKASPEILVLHADVEEERGERRAVAQAIRIAREVGKGGVAAIGDPYEQRGARGQTLDAGDRLLAGRDVEVGLTERVLHATVGDAGADPVELRRAARGDADDAELGKAAVQRGARATDDLDPLDLIDRVVMTELVVLDQQ